MIKSFMIHELKIIHLRNLLRDHNIYTPMATNDLNVANILKPTKKRKSNDPDLDIPTPPLVPSNDEILSAIKQSKKPFFPNKLFEL